MLQQSGSAYQLARLTVLADRLITLPVLRDMISQDLEQISRRIKFLLPGQDMDLKSGHVERKLYRGMYTDFQMLLRSFNSNEYRFLRQAIRWFELANLKVLIRGKFTGVSESALAESLVDVGSIADLPLQNLIETDDPFEMLRLLEQTAYGNVVRRARRVFEEQGQELFSLDSAIDRNFFIELSHRSLFLNQQDRIQLKRVFGVLMDRFNLLWLLRYRFSYGLSSAKSYYLLSATGNQLHSTALMKLAKLESLSSVINELPDKLKQLLDGQSNIYQVEQLMELYSLSAARQGLAHSFSQLTRTFCYLLLREAETRYLIAIIKGKQLGFNDELIAQAVQR